MTLFAVVVHREKLFLLGVKESHDVATFQHLVQVLALLHKQRYLPRCRGIHHIHLNILNTVRRMAIINNIFVYLFASGIINQFVIGRYVQSLATAVDWVHNHFITQNDRIARRT